ncbi:MAG: RHS repeat-associated core domain-containing protein [Phycisphaerae bacterium]|nr:RHS repeat-associated core domain-containing protein [Phycisphaerae bacterium]
MIHTCQRRGPDEAHSACWRTSAAGARGYDAVGRRVETVEYWDAQNGPLDPPRHTRHVYDGLQTVEEYECGTGVPACGSGWSLAREFVWGGRFPEPIAMIDHTAAGLLPANQPEVLHYLHDVLGSVIGLTNSAGTLVERYSYDPYGKTLVERRDPLTGTYELNGADGNFPTWSAFGNPFMWTGQRYDATVGLYHFKYRTYNPIWGRWHQQDPLGYIDTLNLYQYVRSSPLRWRDPFGLIPDIIIGRQDPHDGDLGHTWVEYPGGSMGWWPDGTGNLIETYFTGVPGKVHNPDPKEGQRTDHTWKAEPSGEPIKYGSGKGKTAEEATDEEIIEALEEAAKKWVEDADGEWSVCFDNCRDGIVPSVVEKERFSAGASDVGKLPLVLFLQENRNGSNVSQTRPGVQGSADADHGQERGPDRPGGDRVAGGRGRRDPRRERRDRTPGR